MEIEPDKIDEFTDSKVTAARNWLVTRNFRDGEELDAEEWLRSFFVRSGAAYLVGQLEQGLKHERRHIQAYANFSNTKKLGGLLKVEKGTDYRAVVIDNGARDYCMKQLTRVLGPWEFGKKPVRRNCKADWDEVRELAKNGDFEAIPSDLYISHCAALHKINELNQKEAEDIGHLRGIIIWGKAGIGKSLMAREYVLPGLATYTKQHNKWWTGFKDHKKVIWDDLTPEDAKIFGNQMKLYTDRYAIRGEVKGATVPLNYEYFVITSQYSLEELFKDEETYEAMARRCYVYHMHVQPELGFKSQFSHEAMRAKLHGGEKPDLEGFLKD